MEERERMTKLSGRLVWLVCFAIISVGSLFLPGCGATTGKVEGEIQLDGQPVPEAEIVFQSVQDDKEKFLGRSIESGKYQVDYRTKTGLAVGKYKVTITRWIRLDGKPLPGGEEGEVLRNSDKAKKYLVEFEKEIVAGLNTLDFELKQGQSIAEP
jgi:hypothetical protein